MSKTVNLTDIVAQRDALEQAVVQLANRAVELQQTHDQTQQALLANRGALQFANNLIYSIDPTDEKAAAAQGTPTQQQAQAQAAPQEQPNLSIVDSQIEELATFEEEPAPTEKKSRKKDVKL